MIAKFDIDYIIHPHHSHRVDTFRTDDPVAAEDFLMTLLVNGSRIKAIKHEGGELSMVQADQMIGIAAKRLAARLVADSLGLDLVTVKHRFGIAA
jgi:hypothetical protein